MAHRHVGDGVAARTNHRPVRVVLVCGQVTACISAFVLVSGVPPAANGVVVVGAGVGDEVAAPVVRQEQVGGVAAEAELQDLHAGEAAAVAQFDHVVGDQAEVFGDDRQRAEHAFDRLEEGFAGAGFPFAFFGGGAACGDVVVTGEAAEMVDAEDVGLAQRAAQTRGRGRIDQSRGNLDAVTRGAKGASEEAADEVKEW